MAVDWNKLQTAASATGNGDAYNLAGRTEHAVVYIEWSAATSAGGVTIEEAHDKDYAGTWAEIQVVPWSAESSCDAIHVTGTFGAIRARISTTVVGGTVTAYLIAEGGK